MWRGSGFGWAALLWRLAGRSVSLSAALEAAHAGLCLRAAVPFSAVEEIEQMNSLFQQKQRELVLAVSKVEELSRQLEMLKNGRIDGYHDNQSAVAELDRLYKELQVLGGQPLTLSSLGSKLVGVFLTLLERNPAAVLRARAV